MGMTATVTIVRPADDRRSGFGRALASVGARLSDLFKGPPARPDCNPAVTREPVTTKSLPLEAEAESMTPEQINPGLAPGLSASPRNH
jgi:hypothetical protein